MIADIRQRCERSPFTPFSIRTSDGHEYPVPTMDHIYFPPGGRRVIVSDDKGIVSILTPLHISGIIEQARSA
ncbi:MAG TPA: hypothetical protein VE031_07640 [Chthoniobacterales bacterium]|jgi:hypothetical protein|nr:hypothetical protein [Chthoniobacterales bacterium]